MPKRKKSRTRLCSLCNARRPPAAFPNLTDAALVCMVCLAGVEGRAARDWRTGEIATIDPDLVLDSNTDRRCPGCNVIIFRDGGCAHMICLNCGLDWDWNASSSWWKRIDPSFILFLLVVGLVKFLEANYSKL